MTIIGVRIDGRLIHGQVANLWANKLNVGRFLVVDDEVAGNQIEKSGLKLATPAGVRLSVLPVDKAADHILAGKYDAQRLFIIARRPQPLLQLIEKGVPVETINVGNMSQTDETRSITRSINVVDDDVDTFNKIAEKGVKLTAQMVPSDDSQDFMSLLKKGENK
ncbi:PTS system mannose/fructose/N-acetylgalactosamine-transporter subunit IIB [Xylocopilactobacillus apis]|uniref:PTS mannose transporter subunit IIAB n=1 Tax=Xylocopilactobacillus apis TaxID=2932183 RepID=A0AAU9D987_9LACO|nr:PTS system mannose/fructose/N-acetylgalactosamine-transporter subunit IIB [Xylocopilactobacillus apis]BDR57362.1 PTS mannose transporter subunit IIAB [Xylocopilactobacillus apis]